LADQSKKDAADIQFQKLQRAEDGKKAMSEYEAAEAAVRAKTARLKALRLARDAAAAAAPPQETPAARKKPGRQIKQKTSATLAQWLKGEKGDGRDS
jgi:hypothetical protein